MRKFAAAALAIPVLATLYVPILLRRSIALRLVVGLGIVALLGLGALAVLSPRAIAARAPTVSAPLDAASFSEAVDVAHRLHDPVRLGFSSPMNAASVGAALTIDPTTPVVTSWDAAGKTLTITPRGMWQPGTFYTIKVASTARDAAGQPLVQAARVLFSTRAATTARLALSHPIPDGASTAAAFTVSFDHAVAAPSAGSLLSISPTVKGTLTNLATTASGTSFTFQPDKPLAPGTTYTVALQTGIVDSDGSSVALPTPLRITTAAAPAIVRFRPRQGPGRQGQLGREEHRPRVQSQHPAGQGQHRDHDRIDRGPVRWRGSARCGQKRLVQRRGSGHGRQGGQGRQAQEHAEGQ